MFSKRISAGRFLINLLAVNNERTCVVKNRVMTSILVMRENLLLILDFPWEIKFVNDILEYCKTRFDILVLFTSFLNIF